jgi:hypothetical protein
MDTTDHPSLGKSLFLFLLCLLLLYVASYIALSRVGITRCEAIGLDGGLYFFPPEDTTAWRVKNYGCVYFYYPLIVADEWIGTGKGIGCEPMWRLSAGPSAANPAESENPDPKSESQPPKP